MSGNVGITILNDMAGPELPAALDRHLAWDMRVVDLKQPVPGVGIHQLSLEQAEAAAAEIAARGMSVHCLSTVLFDDVVEIGRDEFESRHLAPVERVVEVAKVLEPRLVRLIAAGTSERASQPDAVSYVRRAHPWLFDAYRDAIDQLSAAGLRTTIENESGPCMLASAAEVEELFAEVDRPGSVSFTWDAVNMWRAGTYPTVEVYERLRPFIAYYHVKGGRSDPGSQELRWKSTLAETSWPIREITARVVEDGVSPVICINPPKGKKVDGAAAVDQVELDVAFMRRLLGGGTDLELSA